MPPLPEKQAVARFSPEFVEERRAALQRFLRRVVLHPELWDAECLLTFLRADDAGFRHAKSLAKGEDGATALPSGEMSASANLGGAGAFSLAPKNKAGIKKWFSEAKTTFSGELVASPDDDLFDEIERYVGALFVQMKRVTAQVSTLVKKNREVANGMFEFGLAFHQLGQSEGEALGRKLQLMGGTADTISTISAQHAEAERRGLEEPLKDYLGIIQAVKLALGRRHDRRVSYTALLHEIRTREENLQRLQMSPTGGAKIYQIETSLQRYRAAADVAREEYAECSQRVLREVDRFKRERAQEMRAVVHDLIVLEIEANKSMEKAWAELVPQLEEGCASGPATAPATAPPEVQQARQPTLVSMPPPSSRGATGTGSGHAFPTSLQQCASSAADRGSTGGIAYGGISDVRGRCGNKSDDGKLHSIQGGQSAWDGIVKRVQISWVQCALYLDTCPGCDCHRCCLCCHWGHATTLWLFRLEQMDLQLKHQDDRITTSSVKI